MVPGFSRLRVTGYRRLRAVEFNLRPLNVLIGANGIGKTSILQAFDLLAASANGDLENAIAESGGMQSLLTADGKASDLIFEVQLPQDHTPALDYQLILSMQGYGYAISHEQLAERGGLASPKLVKYIDSHGAQIRYHYDGNLVEPNWEYKSLESALNQVPKMYREAEAFRHRLADVSEIYHILDVSRRAPVRMPQPIGPADTPGKNGEDLLACLHTIRETARERFESIEDSLRAVFPTFKRLEFPAPANGLLTLGWRDEDFTRPIYANELSEGTLRFLWLITLLQSPGLPRITLIDEPEVSLHPDMLRLLADLMREASARTQLIVATHSDRFVRFLEAGELLVCDRDEAGGMTVSWADAPELDIAAWLDDYSLDQLWNLGRLGGRP